MQAKPGSRARQTNRTVLFVDRGLPIDVIFYASVWEEEGKRRKGEGKQGSSCNALHPRASVRSGSPSLESPAKFTNRTQARLKPHTSTKHPLL